MSEQYATMALEWPDLEAEEKAKAKKAKKKQTPDFIATDSDDEPTTKKKKKERRCLDTSWSQYSDQVQRWTIVPSQGKEGGLLGPVDYFILFVYHSSGTESSLMKVNLRTLHLYTPLTN